MDWACSDNRNPALGQTIGLPNGIFLACYKFNSQSDAQIWLEANPDFGQRVDTNSDGQACGREDYAGHIECDGEVLLLHKCWSKRNSDETR